ncbi:MAG: XdhC family protein [Bacteroidales bacterium]|nr:XdhC family protein [Bacteroidales bacterium]
MELIYTKILEVLKSGEVTAVCTVVATRGSSPLKAGAKMIVWENGKIFGTIGGGPVEQSTIEDAIRVIKKRTPERIVHDLKAQHEMCCGGSMEIFIEPLMPSKKLFMFGGGHVGKAVVKHALDLDFDITVIDSREEIFNDWPFSGYHTVIGDYPKMLPTLSFDDNTFIVIATPDHPTDNEVLAFCIRRAHRYLGMIGSKNKVATMRKNLLTGNIATEEELDRVDMPVGVDIHAVTADEIAISIVARLIQEKNK